MLGLLGSSNTGKDTAGRHIATLRNGACRALAQPLKEFGGNVFDLTQSALYGPSHLRNESLDGYANRGSPNWIRTRTRVREFGPAWIRRIMPNRNDYAHLQDLLEEWVEKFSERIIGQQVEMSARTILQYLGTEYVRVIDKYAFIDFAIENARRDGHQFTVFTDIRFENEVRTLRRHGQPVWSIDRPAAAPLTAGVPDHASEKEQKDLRDQMLRMCTAVVENNDTLPKFIRNIEKTLWDSKL